MSIVIPSILGVSNRKYPYFTRVFWKTLLDITSQNMGNFEVFYKPKTLSATLFASPAPMVTKTSSGPRFRAETAVSADSKSG